MCDRAREPGINPNQDKTMTDQQALTECLEALRAIENALEILTIEKEGRGGTWPVDWDKVNDLKSDTIEVCKTAVAKTKEAREHAQRAEKTNWREQLSFLDNPLQTSGDRILDKELTVRLLWAIYYQANAADQNPEWNDFEYGAEPWQDSSMVSSVCNPISRILRALGAERMDDEMISSGEYLFGVKSPNKYEVRRDLARLQEDITGDWLCITEEEGFLRSSEGRKGVNLYLAWDGSRTLKVDVAGCLYAEEKWERFKEQTELPFQRGKGWHFVKAELFEAQADDESKGDEEREGMAQVICDLFAKIKEGGSQCQ